MRARDGADVAVMSALNRDFLYDVAEIALDNEVAVGHVIEATGGSGANTAVGLARLGVGVRITGIVGSDDKGERIMDALAGEGIDIHDVIVAGSAEGPTGETVILATRGPSAGRMIVVQAGVNNHLASILRRYDRITKLEESGFRPLQLCTFHPSLVRRSFSFRAISLPE